MSEIATRTTEILGIGTLVLEVGIIVVIILVFLSVKNATPSPVVELLRRYALPLIFIFSLAGSVLTLVYSEIFGFAPCGLCWLQRVMLYPLVLLSGIALLKKDAKEVYDYIIGLSIPGALLAFYQHYLQLGGGSFLPCPASPGAADCAQRIIFEFGHITFPYMAFVLFTSMILLSFLARRKGT
jgi:disulfide bond formation protein DsbB